MEDEAGEASSAAAVCLALTLLVLVPVLTLLVRSRWRRAAARREEVLRLAQMAAEESELAERESVLAYYSELFPGVVHAAELPEAPVWGPAPSVVAPSPSQEDAEAQHLQSQPPAGAKGVCAVCFRPTTFRCKQCKAVKYCSFKCQIAHWRQGHKNECHAPSVNTRSDVGDVEDGGASGGNVLVGAKPVAVGSETPRTNHNLTTSNEKNKHLEEVCTSAEIPEDNHSNEKVTISQFARPAADSSKTGSNIKPAIFVESGSTEAIDETLLSNQSSAQKKNPRRAFGSKEALDRRSQHDNVVKECSQTSHNRKIVDNNDPQAAASVHVLQPENSKTPVCVEVEKSKTKPVDDYSIQSTKPVPSVSTDSKGSSVLGGCLAAPDPLKRADNPPEISSKTLVRAGSAANSFASSLKKIVKQQTTAKVVRHYPSESTIFPYEHFVKLYDKVELRPFGLYNLGNSCYANAVLQCLMFTRPLTSYLLGRLHSENCSKREWCFMCEFEKLVVGGKQVRTALSPTGILSHLHDIGSSFGPGKQEDAHEFLRYAIDAMQSACLKEARKGGAHQLAEETTLVQLIFGGYLRSKIRCSRCNVSSEQSERILDLTVAIDGNISSLEEALERFTSTEVLDGENRYQCSSCKSYERAKKKLSISEAPNVLTIALKRYQSGNFGKIGKAIRFPETLNLARYMSMKNDYSPVYSLYAVVVHNDVMNAAFSGHYVCYVKDTQGRWYKADDSQVKPTSLEYVMSKCAYMLLYARCSPRAPSSVRQAMMVQDPARVKKVKPKVVSEGTTLHGGSVSRHQGVQLPMTNDISHTFDDYRDTSYPPAESPSPSESSSLFSNSDAGSHSTVSTESSESTRNSTSTDEERFYGGGRREDGVAPDFTRLPHHDGGHGQQQQMECFSDEVSSRDGEEERRDGSSSGAAAAAGSGSGGGAVETAKRRRGRPPGSKNKPKPPLVVTRDVEPAAAMRPHVLEIPSGGDVSVALAGFVRRRGLGICVLAGTGVVADVPLRHPLPADGAAIVVFRGRYEILSISATFLAPSMTAAVPCAAGRGISVSLAGPQGQIIGGALAGPLIAASTVVVLAAAFADLTFQRLPLEDEPSASVSGSGDADEHRGHQQQPEPPQDASRMHPHSMAPATTQPLPLYVHHHQHPPEAWAPVASTQRPRPPYP